MDELIFRVSEHGCVAQRIPVDLEAPGGFRWISFHWRNRDLGFDRLGDTDVADWGRGSLTDPGGSWWSPMDVCSNPEKARLAIRVPSRALRGPLADKWLSWWFEPRIGLTVALLDSHEVDNWKSIYVKRAGTDD